MSVTRSASVGHRARKAASARAATGQGRHEHAVAHLGGGLPRERDRQDVARIDAGVEQPYEPIDEHARLARAGRGLEHHVVARIDREVARRLIGRRRLDGNGRVRLAGRDQTDSAASASKRYSLRQTPANEHHWQSSKPARTRRKVAGLDVVNRLGKRGGARHDFRAGPGRILRQGRGQLVFGKGQIGGVANRMRAAVARLERLLRAVGVDSDLNRVLVGRPTELVVDDAQRAIVEDVDAVGFAANLNRALTRSPRGPGK